MAVKSDIKRTRRKASQSIRVCIKEERNASFRKVSAILQKAESDRTEEDKEVLFNCSDLVKEVSRRIEKRQRIKERQLEVEDPPGVLAEKCVELAKALSNSSQLVVYTGAGISTAACIPDYRGKNGIWTLLQQGKDIGLHDLTQAEPTLTHMALSQLYSSGLLKYVVSQNCDGLHLRSGLPRHALSEVHGNMYIEVCQNCKPPREYLRLFDVTENTARFSHRTMRHCYACDNPLVDTIVHFGERGKLKWPLNWPAACEAADKADVILCIGSSLKVLKKYPWLWGMDKPVKKRPKLYIVNLQWTPKDDHAVLKISGRCDDVMRQVMAHLKLKIPFYERSQDPIFTHATVLHPAEEHTTTQPFLRASLESNPKPSTGKGGNSKIDEEIKSDISLKEEDVKDSNVLQSPLVVLCVEDNEKGETDEASSKNAAQNFLNPVMEIVYEGVKLKVEGNVSVEASVKIDDDLAIFCDSSKIDQNSFMSSYKLEHDQQNFHFVSVGSCDVDCSEVESDSCHIRDPFEEGESSSNNLEKISDPLEVNCSVDRDCTSKTSIICGEEMSLCIENNSKFIYCADLEKSKITGKEVLPEFSDNLCSFSDSSEKSCFNSINKVGCESGISSSCVLDHCELKVNVISPTASSNLPAIFQIEHNYSKMSPSDHDDVPKTEICSPFKVKGNRTEINSDICSTNALSSSLQVVTPESTKGVLHGTEQPKNQSCDVDSLVGYAKKCSFCKSNYNSDNCLFYRPFDAVFSKSSSSFCECCGEDDDEQSEEEKNELCDKETSEVETDNSLAKSSVVNPGWYGKGYRKRLKRRR